MMRLIDMLAGAGWLLLALFGGQFLMAWRANRARNRAIDAKIAASNAARHAPANRQQRRAAKHPTKKGPGRSLRRAPSNPTGGDSSLRAPSSPTGGA